MSNPIYIDSLNALFFTNFQLSSVIHCCYINKETNKIYYIYFLKVLLSSIIIRLSTYRTGPIYNI